MRSHFRVGTKTTSVLENAYAFHTKTIDYWFYQVLDLWSKGAHVYCFTCFRHHVWKPLKAKGTLQWWCRISSTLEFALFKKKLKFWFIHILNYSQLAFRSRSNWTSIWPGNSNGSWTDEHSPHISTAKEISVKATLFFM